MPLSRLENFLVNTTGNILYVNPSDLDATDSFDNRGNSLTRPFVTIQRALIEAARFSYQTGLNNDRFDRTTILLYPGEHTVDNRPGLYIKQNGANAQLLDVSGNTTTESLLLNNSSIFDLNNSENVLRRFNSVHGGVIVPKGTSIVGLDLRKTKIRPLYVPNPDVLDSAIPRSALFRVTGGCYFWQFSMFDANRAVYYSKNFSEKRNPRISHHKLTCFEYADGQNEEEFTSLTDLQMYYFKLMNAYGSDTGNRNIPSFPASKDFEPNTPESKIVGDLSPNDLSISKLTSAGSQATVVTKSDHGLTVDDQILITGVGNTFYDGSYSVSGITSETQFTYTMNGDPAQNVITTTNSMKVAIEADSVTGASPYIFNCSLRSVFGMCGLHADGSKATGFKSMVVAQFTGIGLQKDDKAFVIYKPTTGNYIDSVNARTESDQGRFRTPLYTNQNAVYRKRYENFHIKCSNDSFIQAVSVFAIGYANHFLSESGGEQSITNSNSNFGAKALVSKGFRKDSFNRDDTGYVTHIVPPKDLQKESTNIIWRTLNVGLSTSNIGGGVGVGETSRLYIEAEKDITNPPTNVANGFKIGARKDDLLYLNVSINGVPTTFTAPILMQTPSGDGPSFEKRFKVSRTTTGNVITTGAGAEITLTENHNFLRGESVVVLADDGRTPDGIKIGRKYFVIIGSADNKIKLANTLNDALKGTPSAIQIDNRLGGVLSVISRVTDKVPGDIGHPIQFDTVKNNWYILSSSTTTTNKIHQGIVGFSTQIKANNSATYVQRIAETRALDDRIYRLRYVIPKEFTETIAKKPEKNYTLQESKTVQDQVIDGNSDVITNRNPKVISGISSTGTTITVTSELPHRLSVNDVVRIKNVQSSTNTTKEDNAGFNGLFTVTGTPSAKTFTYSSSVLGGTFVNDLLSLRNSTEVTDRPKLPVFERAEYDTTYSIQEVETIQDYVSGQQDGIYYLTCLIGNISPTVSEFSDIKYKQNSLNLYPTIDKDNLDNDPEQAVSAASNELLGQVNQNDLTNSITKETIINYLRDNRIGFAVTTAVSQNAGFTTITSNVEHNLNPVTTLQLTAAGTGYGNNTTLFDVPLVGIGITGGGATAEIRTGGSGQITFAKVNHGGSGYGIGMTMSVSGGTGGVVRVNAINDSVGKAIQVTGVGSVDDRNNSDYNGLFKILKVPSTKSVSYHNVPQGQAIPVSAGIYTGPVGTTNGIFTVLDDSIKITNIAGVAGTTLGGVVTVTTQTSHGLSVGNKIKFVEFGGSATANYSGFDFVVKEKIDLTNFTVDTGSRVGTPVALAQCGRLLKYSLNSYGQDSSLAAEKISGSLTPLLVGFTTAMKAGTGIATATPTLSVVSTVGISTGDFLQVDNEVMRVIQIQNAEDLTVLRGVLGTQSITHDGESVVRKIKPIPSELHRFSTIRASGHTFEYIGYGPGNYSTSLPQVIKRTLEEEEELLAISKEEKGGVVFFSGMNDRGDFFSGERAQPRELVLGEVADSNSVSFDDVFIRNTLRVGGGANQNLPSEFNGPVNFTNKVTSTDSTDGIEAIKLLVKGNALNNAFFQVGDDTNPSLIVNKESQNVGINTRNPNTNIELDVNGTIRANVYENFKLSDLPDATEEPNYARNRIIKIKDDGSGYELIDPHNLSAFELRSLNVSNDGTIYLGSGSTNPALPLTISGISTSRFFVGERVKMFGVTNVTDTVTVPAPVLDNTVLITKVGSNSGTTYYYWQAQYHLKNGKVGVSSQIDFSGNYTGSGARTGVANTDIGNFNDTNHNSLTLSRTDQNHGILIYRQNFAGTGTASDANINNARLIATLGQKELENKTSDITWKDFGVYEQTAWSSKGTVNEFLGSDSDTTLTNQIHFPVVPRSVGGRGWDIDQITAVGSNSITVNGKYNLNGTVGFGTTSTVKVVHDNTQALSEAISGITSAGGNYLDLPSGTYLTNKLVIPTQFSLRGNGKNTIVKQQYYATDATSVGSVGSAGTTIFNLSFDGNLVGVAITNPTDITIADVTFDGNSSNNILFKLESENNLLTFNGGTSMLFKDMEIRNAGGGGLFARDSRRISVENSTIVDGGQTDRYAEFRPLDVQSSESVRINDSLFENYPGALDVSVTTVVATGGNIIRNCGSGIDAYATGKITTQNNVILGPADEFIASPDIYDTDFDSINIGIQSGKTFNGPELLYIENGEGFDLSSSSVSISAGIGTIVGLYSTTRTASLGNKFFFFDPITQDKKTDGIDRESGYLQLFANATKTSELAGYVGSSTALGYEIVGTEFQTQPVGFNTFIGIQTGYWANNGNFVNIPAGSSGVGVTQYIIRLDNSNQITGITTGDVVKLVQHTTGPNISNKELTVQERLGTDRVILTFSSLNATSHGSTVQDDDYISIRRIFTIAKGRVGVS